MTRYRAALFALLLVVAAAAAVLSFSALRDLALVCGFDARLAWLLPVTIDAGAAAASIVWLAGWTPAAAHGYGRALALLLLGSSVGGNALSHGLEAYGERPHWLVVVGVSAIAPAVLGALVHLVVLVGRAAELAGEEQAVPGELPDRRGVVEVSRDGAVIDDLRALEAAHGRRWSRDEVKEMYGIGSPRASRLLTLIGWMGQAEGAAR